jgi:hypothetical protein
MNHKIRYEFDGYERENQTPCSGCEIVDSFKNYDEGTWGGALVGTREAVVKTLVKWGYYETVIVHKKLSRKEAESMVDDQTGEDEDDEDEEDE